jgi:hypothetical protein
MDRWRKRLPDEIKQIANHFRKRLLRTQIFEFWRNREKKNESLQGTPVNLLRKQQQTNRVVSHRN